MKQIREESGPESVVFTMGTGRDIGCVDLHARLRLRQPERELRPFRQRLLHAARLLPSTLIQGDYAVFDAAQWLPDRYDDPEYKVPECMIVWGYNIHATLPG